MVQPRKLLIADPDAEASRGLVRALRERGWQLHSAPDGARALEIAVLRHPDLVLFDEAARLLDAPTFIQILRTNPRTEDIPVLVTGTGVDQERLRGHKEGYLRKPFNLDEVIARIDQVFRQSEGGRNEGGEVAEITGNLEQMGIADLLQVLAANRRTGRVELQLDAVQGELHLSEGRPVQGRVGAVEGEKALFRLLAWRRGGFAFFPTRVAVPARFDRGMEDALLEGMRQADESVRFRRELPGDSTPLTSVDAADDPALSTLAEREQELLALLREPRVLQELLDASPRPDLELMETLSALLRSGRVETLESLGALESQPLLQPAELHALRARLTHGRQVVRVLGKLLVAGQPRSVARFARSLSRLPGWRAENEPLAGEFGALGRLHLVDGLDLELLALPPRDEARPLWRPFGAGGLVLIVLDETGLTVAQAFAEVAQLHVVLVGAASVPPSLRRTPGGVSLGPPDPVECLRGGLLIAAAPTVRAVG